MKKNSFFWLGAKQWNKIPRYITDCFCRKQFVQYNGYNSSSLDITCGVPQGSILGPLLFLVYIKNPCNVSKVLELMLFADDTNIFYSHTDASYLMEVVNLELKKITCWFNSNKLRQNRQTLTHVPPRVHGVCFKLYWGSKVNSQEKPALRHDWGSGTSLKTSSNVDLSMYLT